MIPLLGLIDINVEKNRLNKELSNINNEIEVVTKRLNNPMFVSKAPLDVVNEVNNKYDIFKQKKAELEKALLNL